MRSVTGTDGTAYAELRRGDVVLPRGWTIEHITKTAELVAAVGHDRRGRTCCLSGQPTRRIRTLRAA